MDGEAKRGSVRLRLEIKRRARTDALLDFGYWLPALSGVEGVTIQLQ